MKKKLIFAMSAIVALFATSCQEEDFGANTGATSTVAFTVSTPEIASRAYSDGTTATVLQYAVYDETGAILDDLTVTDGNINISTTVQLQLTTGNTYSVLFWASSDETPYSVDLVNKKLTVNYANVESNNENLDAFYKFHTFTVTGAQTETIELKRPFAQLNIGTSDYAASTSAGYTPVNSSVTVKNIYNTLNLADGTVDGETAVTFDYAAIKKDETFPVTGHEYLAMNYLLVDAEKEVIDVEFTYTDGSNAKTRTVGSVPVQRNYRTNIYGQLLTSDVDINIEIKPEYNEPALELDDLHKAALNGGEITLTEDIVLTTPLEVMGNLTINLDGKTISGAYSKSEGAIIKNNGTLTIKGGTIESLGANGGSVIANYGELVVEGTTINGASIRENNSWPAYPINNYGNMTLKEVIITGYQGAVACNAAGTTILENCTINKEYLNTSSHVFYINHADAHVIVNGGTYAHNGMDGSLAYVISGSITVNDGTFSATNGGYGMAALTNGKIVINGGSFAAMPINWGGSITLKGGVFSAKPADNVIAEGYKAVKVADLYHVLPAVVADAAETAGVTSVTESTADVATALTTDNGEATMFMWNDVAYIANYGKVTITSSADEATTVRGVVESAAGLKSAKVAEGIEVVGNRTFRKCANLETVELPSTLTEIGPAVFQSCSNLANVTIPASVTTIGEGAFAECKALTSINIPNGITRLEKDVLRNTGLTSIEIPASVNYIGTYAFRDCESLTEVKILSPEFTIENNTFINAAAPFPTMTIYVVNAEMKAYLDSVLPNHEKSYITVVVM